MDLSDLPIVTEEMRKERSYSDIAQVTFRDTNFFGGLVERTQVFYVLGLGNNNNQKTNLPNRSLEVYTHKVIGNVLGFRKKGHLSIPLRKVLRYSSMYERDSY